MKAFLPLRNLRAWALAMVLVMMLAVSGSLPAAVKGEPV